MKDSRESGARGGGDEDEERDAAVDERGGEDANDVPLDVGALALVEASMTTRRAGWRNEGRRSAKARSKGVNDERVELRL